VQAFWQGASADLPRATSAGSRATDHSSTAACTNGGNATVKQLFAYNFKSPLSVEQMFERLKELGVWQWHERDNDRWGDYISASPVESARHAQVKILVDPEDTTTFAVNVHFESDDPNAQSQFNDMRQTLFTKVLPAIAAQALTETDTYE
jgi:hypothetical protein